MKIFTKVICKLAGRSYRPFETMDCADELIKESQKVIQSIGDFHAKIESFKDVLEPEDYFKMRKLSFGMIQSLSWVPEFLKITKDIARRCYDANIRSSKE